MNPSKNPWTVRVELEQNPKGRPRGTFRGTPGNPRGNPQWNHKGKSTGKPMGHPRWTPGVFPRELMNPKEGFNWEHKKDTIHNLKSALSAPGGTTSPTYPPATNHCPKRDSGETSMILPEIRYASLDSITKNQPQSGAHLVTPPTCPSVIHVTQPPTCTLQRVTKSVRQSISQPVFQ